MTRRGVTIVIVGSCVLSVAVAWLDARQAPEPVDSAMNARIRDEGLNRSQVGQMFGMLVDTIGPRLTGSPGHRRAADWARDSMAKIGLADARLEPFEFGRGWSLEKLTIEMVEPRYVPLLGYAEAWSPSTSGEVIVPVVSLAGKTGSDLDAALVQAKGAAVFTQVAVTNFIATDRVPPLSQPDPPFAPPAASGAPAARGAAVGVAPAARGGALVGGRTGAPATAGRQGGGRGGGPTNAQLTAAGAVVLLKPSRGLHGTVFIQAASREAVGDSLPKIVLAGEHYNMIVRLLQQGTPVKLRVNVQGRWHEDRNSYNVLGQIPGTDPSVRDEVVMLGAHLDSWHTGTGATDNADGAAVALEAFRILKALGVAPRRTLSLALWSGEEEGLLGSKAWVAAHITGPENAAARAKMNTYFNIDPGKGPIYGWYLENNAAIKPIFDAWLAPFKDLGMVRNLPQGIGNTDHLSFIAAGVPGFNALQDYVDYDVREHHTNADLFERIDERDLKQNAVVLASFLYHAAMRAQRLPSPLRPQ